MGCCRVGGGKRMGGDGWRGLLEREGDVVEVVGGRGRGLREAEIQITVFMMSSILMLQKGL